MNYIPFKRNEPKRYSDQCNKILNNNNNNIYKEKRKIITDISPFNLDKHIKFNNLNSKCYNESEIYAINNQINFSKEKSETSLNAHLTEKISDLEKQIYEAPEYYLWTHKRWKHKNDVPNKFQ